MIVAVLAVCLTTLFPMAGACADSPNDSFTPSLVSPAVQDDAAVLNRRLLAAKNDLEQFLLFAEHFSSTGDTKTAGQLQGPLDDFLKRHVDPLLVQGAEQVGLDTTRLSAEILLIKARLFLNLNQPEATKATVADMKKRFGPYLKNTVQVSGRSAILGEAVRQLDEELATPARTKKK